MPAAVYNILIEQGAEFTLPLIISSSVGPRDLTNFQARSMIRSSYSAKEPLINFTISGSLNASGSFALTLSASQTAELPASTAVYDLELFSGSVYVERALQGKVTISPEATK